MLWWTPLLLLLMCAAACAAASDRYYLDIMDPLVWIGCPPGSLVLVHWHDAELAGFWCRECPEGFFSDGAHASACSACAEAPRGAAACLPLAADDEDGDGLVVAAAR